MRAGRQEASFRATKTPRPALEKRRELIDSVCAVIAERGYEQTRFSDVAARSGASIGSLQYLFGTREDMIIVALEHRTARELAEVAERAEKVSDPVRRLAIIVTHLASGSGEEQARREWLVWTEYWRAALRDESLRSSSASAYASWMALLREAIEECVAAGHVRAPADLESVAAGAVALGDGLGIQIALNHPGMTWDRAAEIVRAWLAVQLGCPALADPVGS